MKNTLEMAIRGELPFYPCGLQIPTNAIFDSERNLGLSLMSALTGIPTECLEFNKTEISIGLGCFGLIGISAGEGDEDCKTPVEEYDETRGWDLLSVVSYTLGEDNVFDVHLNILPDRLLLKDRGAIDGVQLFGPHRLLRRLRSADMGYIPLKNAGDEGIWRFLVGVQEANDTVITPSEEEFELYWDVEEPGEKFRILLNMITAFASTLSAKLMQYGHVESSTIFQSSEAVRRELHWLRGGNIPSRRTPPVAAVEKYMKKIRMKKSDVCQEARKLLWPRKA